MEWKEVTLGDLCEISSSKRIFAKEYQSDGVPFYRGKEIIAKQKGNAISNELFISRNRYEEIKARYGVPQQRELLLTSVGTLGVPYVIKEEEFYFKDGNLTWFRHFNGLDVEYLYYWFLSPYGKNEINTKAIGSTQKALTIDSLSKFDIKIPVNLDDQRRIASILSSLDRKIELNNKINADLEEMAQAIFKNWFVDFEPFKGGKFVDSELGMIPEGWKVSQIADIPHILETGKRPKGGAVEKGIPSVGAEHVKGMCAYDYSKTKYINCEFAAKLKTGKINGYELMIYKDGGKPGYFIPNFSIFGEGYPFENCYLNEHVFKLDFDGNKEFNIFCYFFFKTEQIMSYFNAQGAKAAIPGINKKDVENIYIFSPDNESVIKFGEFAYPLFKQMLKNAIENRTLSTLRDTLLPRLMSGELEVPE